MTGDLIGYGIVAAVLLFIASKIYEGFKSASQDARSHCMTCGTDAEPRTHTRGSIWIEVILWLLLIVPGLVYSVWRLTSKRQVCSACGSAQIVPYNAPAAVAHRRTLQQPTP